MKVELLSRRAYNGTPSSCAVVQIELTRRNLLALLEKLDDPLSERTLVKSDDEGTCNAFVTAVEDDEHYSDRAPGLIYKPSSREFQ